VFAKSFFVLLGFLCLPCTSLLWSQPLPLVWPTPNRAFLEGKPYEDYIQPTGSGRLVSGLFGCTRNGGNRFHEGIDLKAIQRDRQGRATDPIFAAMPGKVVHVSRIAGNSSYGVYVVLEHKHDNVTFYTLYAHLASVKREIQPGREVRQGTVLGVMGNTAGGYTIPQSRAHLHFEIGVQLNSEFNWWFSRQGFGSPNQHGAWNGMNLNGLDPIAYYRAALDRSSGSMRNFLLRQPTGVTVRVRYDGIPDYVQRSPGLVKGDILARREGWDVDIAAFGIPVRFRPLPPGTFTPDSPTLEVRGYDSEEAFKSCYALLTRRGDQVQIGRRLQTILDLIFRMPQR